MLRRILTNQQEKLLKEERRWLGDLRVALARFDVAPEDQVTLDQSIGQLDELFLLVVVGEFNAGKSLLINALLGEPVLEEGVRPRPLASTCSSMALPLSRRWSTRPLT